MKRPKGSSPARSNRTWICFHCECALPVVLSPGEDDPDLLAALEWTEGFRPASDKKVKNFWAREHARAAAEHEEWVELQSVRREVAIRRREEKARKEKKKSAAGVVEVR